jgi:RNA polymerase sigma-70 factor (ECF subfamily)
LENIDDNIIKTIRAGDYKAIVTFYDQYKKEFVHWAIRKFPVTKDDALDIFQDTMIAFLKNIKRGRIEKFEHSVKSYLYAIGRHLLLNKVKFEKRYDNEIDENTVEKIMHEVLVFPDKVEHDAQLIDQLLNKLGEPCYTILKLFYYRNYSLESVAREIGSKGANVARAQKARCIKNLKDMFLQKIKNDRLAQGKA